MSEYGGTTVDERVVEMRIDNDKFEAGAKKTISILESLDNSLNNLGKKNASGWDDVAKTMDSVTNKFSMLGTIGDQVMRNLTNQAMHLANEMKNMVTSLTTQQIDAGWNKYADKTSSIQTIMAATNKDVGAGKRWADQAEQLAAVNEQLEKLMWFTDETSYNFNDMVGNIGKFTAAGRDLEESVTAMEGIANWAAISGGRPAEASRAMYNLSQALGMGYVGQADWKSIELANMATYEFKEMVIDTAEQMGVLRKVADGVWETTAKAKTEAQEVTVETFRENLKYQWFNSDVLLSVLNRYGEFTEQLKVSTDALNEISATDMLRALDAFDKMSGPEAEAAEGLQKLTDIAEKWDLTVEEMIPHLQILSSEELNLGRRAFQAAQEAKTFAEAIEATKDAVSSKWSEFFEKIFGDYLEAKKLWTDFANTLYDVFAAPLDKLNAVMDELSKPTEIVQNFVGTFDAAAESVDAVAEHVEQTGKNLNAITHILNQSDMGAYLQNKDWKQIELAGYATEDFKLALLEAAEKLGDLKKVSDGVWESITTRQKVTVANFRNSLGSTNKDGWLRSETLFSEFSKFESGIEKINSFNEKLADAHYSTESFWKSLENVLGTKKFYEIANKYGGMAKAIEQGGVSSQEFRKALELLAKESGHTATEFETLQDIIKNSDKYLSQLHDGSLEFYTRYTSAGYEAEKQTESLDERLKKAGRTMNDLQDAMKKVDEARFDSIISEYGSLDRALKEGAIDAEYFRKALELMSQDTTHVADGAEGAVHSLEEMRKVAMGVLRGDYGNGEDRRKRLEELGYDYDTIQWLAGNLGWMMGQGWDVSKISDDYLMSLPKPEAVAKVLEGSNKQIKYTQAQTAAMNQLLRESDVLLKEIQNGNMSLYAATRKTSAATKEEIIKQMSPLELLRQGFKNIMQFIDDVANGISEAFDNILGKKEQRAERWKTVIRAFYDFTESIQFGAKYVDGATTKYQRFVSTVTGILRVFQSIGKVIKLAFSIVKTAIKSVFYILSPFLELFGQVFQGIAASEEAIEEGLDLKGVENFFKTLGDGIREFLNSYPIIEMAFMAIGNAISFVSNLISSLFSGVVSDANREVGIFSEETAQNMDEMVQATRTFTSLGDSFTSFLDNHPLLKSFVDTVEKVINFITGHIGVVFDILKIAGFGIVMVIDAIIIGISNLFGWFGDGTEESSKLGTGIDKLKKKFSGFEKIITDLSAKLTAAFKQGGIQAAVTTLFSNLEKGFRSIIPEGTTFINVLSGIWNFIKNGLGMIAGFLIAPVAGLSEAVSMLWSSIGGKEAEESIEGAENNFTKFRNALQGLSDVIFSKPPELKQKVINYLTPIWEGIVEFARSVKFRDVISALRLAVITTFFGEVLEFIDVFGFAKKQAENILEQLGETIFDLGYMFRKLGTSFQANALLKFAAAIAILGIVIYNLTKLAQTDTEDKMTYVTTLLISLMLVMSVLINVMNRSQYLSRIDIKQFTVIPRIMGALIGLAFLVIAMANAMTKINAIGDLKKIAIAFAPIGIIIAMLLGTILGLTAILSRARDLTETGAKFRAVGTSVMRIAGGMMFIALAVQMLILPIALLTKMFQGENGIEGLDTAALVVGRTFAALALFMLIMTAALGMIQSNLRGEQITAVGKAIMKMCGGMLILALAVDMLLVPIGIIAAISAKEGAPEAIDRGIRTVGIILAIVAGFIGLVLRALSKLSDEKIKMVGNAFLKIAFSMLIISSAISMLIVPLVAIATLAKDHTDEFIKAKNALLMFAGIFALLSVTMLAIGAFGKNTEGIKAAGNFMIKLAASMLIFSAAGVVFGGALLIIAAGLAALSDVIPKIQDFGKTLLTLVVIAGAMWLFGAAAKSIGSGLLAMAASFLVFASGLYVLGYAMDSFSNWYPRFKNFFTNLWTKLKEKVGSGNWGTFIKFIGVFTGLVLVLKLLIALSRRTSSLFSFFDIFKSKAKDSAASFGSWIGNIPMRLVGAISKIGEAFMKHKEQLAKAIAGLLIVVGAYIIDIIPTVTDMIVKAIIELLFSVARSINEHRSKIVEAIIEIFAAIFNLIGDVFAGLGDLWNKLTKGGKWAFGISTFLAILYIIPKIVQGIRSWADSFKDLANSSDRIAKNGDKIIEVAKETAQAGAQVSWESWGQNSTANFVKNAAATYVGAKAAGAGAGGAAVEAAAVGFWAKLFAAGSSFAGPVLMAIGSLIYAGVFSEIQNNQLRKEAYKDKDYNNLQDRINGLNELREAYEKSIEELDTLAEYYPEGLTQKQDEVNARLVAWHDELKALAELTGQTEEEILHQFEDTVNPFDDYIKTAYQNRNVNKELKISYEELARQLGINKELFYQYLQQEGSAERAVTMLSIDHKITTDDIDAVSSYLSKCVELENAVKILNQSYDILAQRLGITRSEFDRQLQKAGGDISQMDAYIARQKECSDLIQFNIDGTSELTEKGKEYNETQVKAAEEKLKQFEALAQQYDPTIDYHIEGMSSEEILNKFNEIKSGAFAAVKQAGFNEGSLFSIDDVLEKVDPMDIAKILGVESWPEGIATSLSDNSGLLEPGFEDLKANAVSFFNTIFEVNSPSHVFQRLGESIPEGVLLGIKSGIKVAGQVNPFARLINYLIGNSSEVQSSGQLIGNGFGQSIVDGTEEVLSRTTLADLIQGSGRSAALAFEASIGSPTIGSTRNMSVRNAEFDRVSGLDLTYAQQFELSRNQFRKWMILSEIEQKIYELQEAEMAASKEERDKVYAKWDELIRTDKDTNNALKLTATNSSIENTLNQIIEYIIQTTENLREIIQNGSIISNKPEEKSWNDAFVDSDEWQNIVDKYNLKYLLGSNSNVSEYLQGKDFIKALFDKAIELGYLEYDFPEGEIPDKIYYKTTDKAEKAGESFSYNFNLDEFTDSIPLGWLTDAILEEVIKAFNLVPKSPEVKESGEEIGNTIGESAYEFIQSSWEDFLQSDYYKPGQETIYWEEGLGTPEGWYTFDNNSTSAMYAGTAYRKYLYDQLKLLEDKSEEANTEFMDGLNRLREESERNLSAHGFTGRTRNVTGKAGSIQKSEQGLGIEPVGNRIIDWEKYRQDAEAGGQKYAQGIKAGVEQGLPEVGNIITNTLDSYNKETLTLSGKIPESMANGIMEKSDDVTDAVKHVQVILSGPWSMVSRNFYTYGSNIASGLASGLQSRYYQVSSIVSNLASMVSRAFTSILKIRSPSRVFEYYGQMIDEGLMNGINESSEDTITSIVVLSNDIIDAIHRRMAEVGTLARDSLEDSMMARPVIDFSGIGYATDYSQYLAASRATEAEYLKSLRNLGNASAIHYDTSNIQAADHSKEIIGEIQAISTKVGKLGQEITNMKVVLSTGALVGELAPAMNRQLGTYASRELRQ